ncbi:MAG: PAS domain S-box protein [Rhizonema sp. PD37]|nr:PAS domain S-box protein [Rhizonema sp. PD37]
MASIPLEKEIEQRFGVLPNFFMLASDTPEVTMNLWGFARFAYLNSPLPSLFKERLFVYLSRFCEVRYCIARHVGFLVGLGYPAGDRHCPPQTIEQVLRLLQRELPRGKELETAIALCAACDPESFESPSADTAEESAIFACATHVFLQTPDAFGAMVALRQMFGTARMEFLNVFLAFVRMAHYWTLLHPELRFEDDINHLLTTHVALANCLLNDPEVEDNTLSQRVLSELAELRQLKQQHQSIVQSYEVASRESEARFRSVFSNNMVAMGTWTGAGDITDANDALLDLIGYTRPELEAGSIRWIELTPPEYSARDQQAIAEVMADDACTPYEKEFIHKDGHRIPIMIGGGYFNDQNGAGIFFALDFTDRKRVEDERKQAEAALQQSEARFRRIFECEMVPMGIWTNTGEIVEANDTLLDLIGYTRQELETGQINWQALTPSQYGALDQNALSEIAAQGFSPSYEKVYLHKDGRRIPILIGGASFLDEPNSGFFFVIDLTVRKRTEAQLREAHVQLESALAAGAIYTWRWKIPEDLVIVNAAFAHLFGVDPQMAAIGLPIELFVQAMHPDDRPRVLTAINQAIQTGENYAVEYRVYTADGSERWLAARGRVEYDADGRPFAFPGALADITDRKIADLEREQLLQREQAAREAAENANRIKDEFLAVVSHELRSPLNPILGWSKLLQQGKLDSTKTAYALATIERNAQLQVQLIDDLLDISRILRGKLSLNQLPVNLRMVIGSALETVRLAAEAKSLHLETNFPPQIVTVIGDAGRLQQVVWNLLSNAVKFTPQCGRIMITLTQEATHAQIQVKDNGKGINSDFLPYVFEHFRQEDGATTRKFGGLGLGMAIARQIVELHGGTIAVDSPGEGQGATFTVLIPLAAVSSQTSSIAVDSISMDDDLSDISILVVDDEPDSCEFVAFVLELAGASVTSVTSGIEALQAIRQSVPDLIISDIGMPEMDGYMLMRQIRALQHGRQISAIALTAYAGELDRQQAIISGFQRHLAKPVEPTEIIVLVAHLCGQKGQQRR